MIETSSTGLDQPVKSKFNYDFLRAIFVTLLLVSIYRLGIQVPIPFLNEDALKEYFGVQIKVQERKRKIVQKLFEIPKAKLHDKEMPMPTSNNNFGPSFLPK